MSTVNSFLNRFSRAFFFVTKSAILIFRPCRTFSLLKRANRTKTTGWLLCSNKLTAAYITHHDVWKNICQKNIVFFSMKYNENERRLDSAGMTAGTKFSRLVMTRIRRRMKHGRTVRPWIWSGNPDPIFLIGPIMLTANSATIYHLIFAPRFYLVPNFIGKAYKIVRRSDQMIEISNDIICHSIIWIQYNCHRN